MPQCASTTALVERTGKVEPMQIPLRPSPRESTEAMVRNIARVAEPRLTGTWLAHLLIESARRPPSGA